MEIRNLLLPAASALILAGCGENLTKEQIIDYGEIGYADIVSYIVEGYQSRWDGMNPQEMNLSPVYIYSSPYAGFVKADIDNDGYDELLIGDQFEDGSYALYDICCFNKKDASVVHLVSGGEKDRFTVTESGVIVECGSNSADESFTKGFVIKNDKLIEVNSWGESLMPIRLERFSDLAYQGQLCGGYTGQREPSEDEMLMFKSLSAALDMTLTPLSVSTQVVAGINYRFWCRYQDKDGSGHCWVVVYKPLPGHGDPSITSIDKQL